MNIVKTAAGLAAAAALAVGLYASGAQASVTCEPQLDTTPFSQGGTPCGSGLQKGFGFGTDVSVTPANPAQSTYSYGARLVVGKIAQAALIDSQGFIVKKKNGGGTNCPPQLDGGTPDATFKSTVCTLQTPGAAKRLRIVVTPL